MKPPRGAQKILQARKGGQRPADPVVVSLCGHLAWGNPTVYVTERAHDWTFAIGLDAIVCVRKSSANVAETLMGLARVCDGICLWDVERSAGMDLWPVWKGKHVPEVLEIPHADRQTAIFVRWAKVTWLQSENRRFAG